VEEKKEYVILISGSSEENISDHISTVSQEMKEELTDLFSKEME
jgi:hypothetical protein